MIDLIVLGASGNTLGIIDAVEELNRERARYRVVGILDDIPANQGRMLMGVKVIGTIDDSPKFAGCRFVNGISSVTSFRKIPEIVARTGQPLANFESIVHPRATIASSARIGRGSVVLAGSVLCTEAELGDHVIVLQNTSVNHHSRIGDYSTLSAGITILGYVDVGRNALVGGGSSLAPQVKVGEGVLVGTGSVVIRDLAAGRVYAGNPAREIVGSRYAEPSTLNT